MHYQVILRNTKITFSSKCCISALPEFNQLFDFFNLLTHESRLTLKILYDSLNHVINAFGPQGCWGAWFGRKEVESAAGVGLCTSALSFGFPISQGNAEAPERWGGKPKCLSSDLFFFLSNTSAKSYRNRIVCVNTTCIASQMWDVFETRCRSLNLQPTAFAWPMSRATIPLRFPETRCQTCTL